MPLIYATVTDWYSAGYGDEPDNLETLIRQASVLVRRATRTALYDTTSGGLPLSADTAAAFRDATLAHVKAWADLEIDPTSGAAGVSGQVQSSSIGGASITYAQRAGTDVDKVATLHELVPDALAYLDAEGLINNAVQAY